MKKPSTTQQIEKMYRTFYWGNQKVVPFPVPCETKNAPQKEVN